MSDKEAIQKQEAERIIREMVRAGAVCEQENGYVFEFDFPDLHLHLINQNTRLLLETHRPLLAEDRNAYKKAKRDHLSKPSSVFVEKYWFNERIVDGEVFFSVNECLSWLEQIRRAKRERLSGPPPPPSPAPPAESVIEDRVPGRSWFARLGLGLWAWWNNPPDRRGYNNSRFAKPCHRPSVVPPESRRRKNIIEFTRLAADLSATTHISPGEALEMIRKAGNFASREELDRLMLENAELRRALEACSCGLSSQPPNGEESPAARSISSLCELFDAVRAFRFYHGPHCPQGGCTCGLDRIKAALKALDENR